ncbi:MAG: glycosyltransferase [Dehalococcoidales bacterium]|nr:glycosyltransferase [Dehalococcoidales bacterium]
MKILVVHEVDWLKKVVYEIHNISEQMSRLGHDVFAIDYEDTWQRNGMFDFGTLRTRVYDRVSRTIPDGPVCLTHPGFIKIPGLSRVSAAITHYREIKRVITREKIDVILLYSVPTNGLQTLRLAKKYGIPVVFRSIDILHRLVKFPCLRPATKLLEKRIYKGVDKILAIAPQYADYVVRMGADPEKVRQVLMPIDTTLFRPTDDYTELYAKWNLSPEDKVILFVGTLFHFSGLDGFLRLLPGIIEKVPEAKLLIVGDGPQRSRLEELIGELNLRGHAAITGFQPYETMPQYMNLATVCINTFPNDEHTGDTFPGKVIQYLACGRPTVVTPQRALVNLLPEDAGIGYGEGATMAAEITDVLQSRERRKRMGEAGLAYVERTHTYDIISRQFEAELIETVENYRRKKPARSS